MIINQSFSSKEWWGLFSAVLSATALAAEGIAAKVAYAGGANMLTTLAIRYLISALLLWGSLIIIPLRWNFGWKVLGSLVLLALFGQATTVLALFYSFQFIPAAITILFFYIYPAIVTILAAIFLHEPMTKSKIGALILSFLGLIVILGLPSGAQLDIRGILGAIIAALTNAFYLIGQTKIIKNIEPRVYNYYNTLIMGIAFLLLALTTGTFNLNFNVNSLIAIIILALVCTIVAYMAMSWGLRYIGASRLAIISTLEPGITALLGYLILKEKLQLGHFLGGILVLIGVVWQQIAREETGSCRKLYDIIKK
ncbi:MAG: hypothetical protein PWP31_476 [Clostridia bacterium]|nr:hypothetical protein [Clostridia bacterium]